MRVHIPMSEAPEFQEALDRAIERVNASSERAELDALMDAAWADLEASISAKEKRAAD